MGKVDKIEIFQSIQKRYKDIQKEIIECEKEFSQKFNLKYEVKKNKSDYFENTSFLKAEKIKSLYKMFAKHSHPDKEGGNVDYFLKGKEYYDNFNEIEFISVCIDFGLFNEGIIIIDEKDLEILINHLELKISSLKRSIGYIYRYGSPKEKIKIITVFKKVGEWNGQG